MVTFCIAVIVVVFAVIFAYCAIHAILALIEDAGRRGREKDDQTDR